MKSKVIYILHKILGFNRYLFVFSVCKISTLRFFRKKWDYLHFVKQLKPNYNVLVIGASTGITSIPLARQCREGQVFAYEPLESNYATIKRLLQHYKLTNCHAYKVALSDKAEANMTMLQPVIKGVRKQGMAHLNLDDIEVHEDYLTEKVEVSTVDLREELSDVKIDAIKLVAENSELEILGGAKFRIMKDKPVIYCELWDNEKRDRVIKRMESYGYECVYRSKGAYQPVSKNNYRNRNLFFYPVYE